MKVKQISSIFIIVLMLFIPCTIALSAGQQVVYAQSDIFSMDGEYNVSYSIGGQSGIGANMIAKYFDSNAIVEKIGNNYYASITQLSSSMQNLSLNLEDGKQVGYSITYSDANKKTYRFTLSKENLSKELPFSVFVAPRDETFYFTIRLNLANATRIGDIEDATTDRPAEFVPVISTTSGNEYETAQGSVFTIPEAKATLGEENCKVRILVYYLSGDKKIEVSVTNNQFSLDEIGEYNVVYRAESSQYKSLLGNNTFTEKIIKILSLAEGGTLAKFEDPDGVLDKGVSIQASRLTEESTIYNTVAEQMKTIATNFEVFQTSLINTDGSKATPLGEYVLYIKAKSTYDRNDIVVYYMAENGSLIKISSENGGSYVKINTDKTGTFIVCIPGVDFVMPMWGYALIIVGSLILIAGITTSIVLIVKKHKKKVLQDNANS